MTLFHSEFLCAEFSAKFPKMGDESPEPTDPPQQQNSTHKHNRNNARSESAIPSQPPQMNISMTDSEESYSKKEALFGMIG